MQIRLIEDKVKNLKQSGCGLAVIRVRDAGRPE